MMTVISLMFSILMQLETSEPTSVKYYTFLGTGRELQMKVSVWGEIDSPGMYSIPEGSDLLLLITIAGGPTRNAAISSIKIVRSFPEPRVLHVDLDTFFDTGRRDGVPVLSPGDMVFVNRTRYRSFKDILGVLGDMSYVFGFCYMVYKVVK